MPSPCRWLVALVCVSLLSQSSGRTQGLSQNQFAGLVERTVAGVRFGTLADFTIERVNPVDRPDSYVVITFDSQGRLAVSKENDHPRLLLDADGDGILESEKVISDRVRNCQGLWFDGPTLYGSCVQVLPADPPAAAAGPGPGGAAPGGGRQGGGGRGANSPAGIFRMSDTDGNDVADTVEVLGLAGAIEEHGAHAIRRAPDGGWVVIVGNNQTIADPHVDLGSPVLQDKDAQLLPYLPNFGRSARQGAHSAIFSWKEATKQFSVFSGGNRNAYDFAFNLAGEAFLFDSDMEWDIGMPWYRDVRTVHEIPNGNYGYRDGSGKYPPYYLDSLPAMRDLGRGSPVGVETYQSYAYPRAFFDNLIEGDWSRGRILYTGLTPSGATYTARSDRAELIHGEPLNVTDMEVGPDGMLYFTTGGRNTIGGVWRLRYTGTAPARPDMTGVLAVVRQPQPLSSWSWAAIERVKASMGAGFGTELERLARNRSAAAEDRARAVYEMQRHGPAPSATLLVALAADSSAAVRAAAAFAAGVQGRSALTVANAGLKDADPLVRRRAAEAIVRMGQSPDRPSLVPIGSLYPLLADSDRFVRWSGRILVEHTPRADWAGRVLADTNPVSAIEGLLAWVRTAGRDSRQPAIDRELALLARTNLSPDDKLRIFRLVAYTASELQDGPSTAERVAVHAAIAPQFPSTDERLNREMALLMGYAGQPAAIGEILAAMPAGDQNPALQLHYLYALRVIKQGWTAEQKTALADVLGRTSKWRGGAQFSNFLNQYFEQFAEVYATDAEKALLYARAPDFAPLTPEEIAAIQARGGGPGRGAGGGAPAAPVPPAAAVPAQPAAAAAVPAPGAPAAGAGGGGRGRGAASPVAARTQGRVLNKGEIFDEVIYTPRTQQPNVEQGRALFETTCASCHRFGSLGNDHGVAALNLTTSGPATPRRDLLESIMFPSRAIAAAHETSVVTRNDGTTASGLVVADDAKAVRLLTAEGTTIEVAKPIASVRRERTTIMKDSLTDAMGQAQLSGLLAFLQTR